MAAATRPHRLSLEEWRALGEATASRVELHEGAQEPHSAADVLLAVEVLSPGTRRVDLVMMRSEYADAGIPHYWIVDLDASTLEALAFSGDGYESVTATRT
ncbi:Uma2 family endonuclease [Tsukamurella tyrosinosolvens]|uniref:Uma2 family endonuclease n=1 Tax=Tsukamurella tyrosinosolvens TaxID=57704 RepID=UPI0009EDE868|nr:Uma2 family endonuclease [Tsukamurella tyrosinosolvens]MCA4995831.1 Uma2 family endonuclease [Tsukamurella tyrosinosolvens]